jgi:tripartite-type tricarboxylate transporter receptor subunit TctC
MAEAMNKTIAALFVLLSASAAAGAYSGKEIELVNAYPATGPAEIAGSIPANKVLRAMQNHAAPPVTDVLARNLRQALSFVLDAPVTLERRSRRQGIEGHRYVARAAPDGHTLLLAGSDTVIIHPRVVRETRFDPRRELVPVALLARMPMVLIAASGSSVTSVPQFLERARSAPGRLHLGSSGEFTTAHLAAVLFTTVTGTALEHVSFNGGAAAARGVIAEQIEAAFVPLPAVLPYAANPRLRPWAVADRERHPALKDVPTLGEAGVPGAEVSAWYGVFAPAATPRRVVSRINAGIAVELQSAQMQRLLLSQGLRAAHLSPDEFLELIHADDRRWAPLIDKIIAR